MSADINDGGAAFPEQERVRRMGYETNDTVPVAGMRLRDYFAAKALAGLICEPASEGGFGSVAVILQQNGSMGELNEDAAMAYATASYLLADAMLKARSAS